MRFVSFAFRQGPVSLLTQQLIFCNRSKLGRINHAGAIKPVGKEIR